MDHYKQKLLRAKMFCSIVTALVGYNFIMLTMFNLSPEQTSEYILNGQVMTCYFFMANAWHDYLAILSKEELKKQLG